MKRVSVKRKLRITPMPLESVPPIIGLYYLSKVDAGNGSLGARYQLWQRRDQHYIGDNTIHSMFTLPYDVPIDEGKVVVFDSFKEMCEWVAADYPAELLQGNVRQEWFFTKATATHAHLTTDLVYEVMEHTVGEYVGRVFIVDPEGDLVMLDNGKLISRKDFFGEPLALWELSPGDEVVIGIC